MFIIGEYFEYSVKGTETHTKKYYGREVLRVDNNLHFTLTDHLGSTSIVTDANGENIIEQRYDAWGKTQYLSGSVLPTDKVQKRCSCLAEWHSVPFCTYTGQRHSRDIDLYDYRARWGACPERQRRDPLLGRFLMEDAIIPNQGVMRLDRYAYVNNRPIFLTDPTGNMIPCEFSDLCDHLYEIKPLNPWRRPPEESMIGRDKAAGVNEDYEQLFLKHVFSPLPGYSIGNFGSCNTLIGNCEDGWHPGIDSRGAKQGTPIYSTAYGIVVSTGREDFGNFVMVEHCLYNGVCYYSVYAHLQDDSIKVDVGMTVNQTTILASVGNTVKHGTV